MIKFIKQELPFEKSLKQRLDFICKICKTKPIFINGNIIKIDKTNLVLLLENSNSLDKSKLIKEANEDISLSFKLRMVIPKTFEIILGFAIFLVVFTKKISFSLAESYIPLKFMLLYIPYDCFLLGTL